MSDFLLPRREFLRVGTIGAVSLAHAWPRQDLFAAGSGSREINCIVLHMDGGMSHIDLWDPKPDASTEVRGEFSAIDSVVPGMRLSELLPRTARVAARFSIVRSVTHDEIDHGRATDVMKIAHQPGTSSGIAEAFEIGCEPDRGVISLQSQCRRASQLIEAGCRFVRIESGHWDTHSRNAYCLRECLAPEFDQAFPDLLEDLRERGLLESTLVLVTTEFGRTPRINSLGGRDHWPRAFSVVMAGAGVEPGQVIGATDRNGAEVVERPFTPAEIAATVRQTSGIASLAAL